MLSSLAGRLTRRGMGGGPELGGEYLFERTRFGKLPTERIAVVGVQSPRLACRRLHATESAFASLSELRLDLPRRSWVSVTSADVDRYSLVLWVETSIKDWTDHIAERAELVRRENVLALCFTPEQRDAEAVFRWEIIAPHDRPVTITGDDAIVGVYDMNGPVTVSVRRGHVAVLESSGTTDITAAPQADVVWAGRAGTVNITSAIDVALKLTDETFAGLLRVDAAQSIRLWVPRGCDAGIEADVGRADAITCRAGLVETATRRRRDRLVRLYGSHEPRLYLTSKVGRIVIENTRPDGRAG
jgi:hypothetical protein